MTKREQERCDAALSYLKNSRLDLHQVVEASSYFIAGAKWADEHPKKGLVSMDKVCAYLEMRLDEYIIRDLKKVMEE